MDERACVRDCKQRGVHYATCASYGIADAGGCDGCAPVIARHGAMVCDRCYGRLRARIEVIPDLVAMLRSLADPRKATAYDRTLVKGSAPEGIPAPVPADVLDAQIDILHSISAGQLRPGAESDEAYEHALVAVGRILRSFEAIANDSEVFLHWWELIMPAESEKYPELWTATRIMRRWPLEDRRRWAKQPCPECGLKTVRIDPPRHRHALTWFSCSSCKWARNENDDEGLWASAFGLHVDQPRPEKEMPKQTLHPALDLTEAVNAGAKTVGEIDSSEPADPADVIARFMLGATPEIAEAFAAIAEEVATVARSSYENGALLASGARLVATAIRDAAETAHLARDEVTEDA